MATDSRQGLFQERNICIVLTVFKAVKGIEVQQINFVLCQINWDDKDWCGNIVQITK